MTQSAANNIQIITRTALITAASGGICHYFVCEYTELNLGLGFNFNKYISSAVLVTILFGFVNNWRIFTNLLANTDGTKVTLELMTQISLVKPRNSFDFSVSKSLEVDTNFLLVSFLWHRFSFNIAH